MTPEQIAQLADRIIAEAKDDEQTAALTTYVQQLTAWQAYIQAHNARSREYLSFVQAGGYAAFLTIWSATQADLPGWARFGAIAFLGFSLCLFISYELCKAMVTATTHNLTNASIFGPDGEETPRQRLFKLEADIRKATQWAVDIWPPVFGLAAITGLVGALLLVFALAQRFASSL